MLKRKINCWEFKKCGREVGGARSDYIGICPAAYQTELEGIHDGTCGGRACWVVEGTLCTGVEASDFDKKYRKCAKCDFYEYVKEEEGDDLLPTVLLLSLLEEKV